MVRFKHKQYLDFYELFGDVTTNFDNEFIKICDYLCECKLNDEQKNLLKRHRIKLCQFNNLFANMFGDFIKNTFVDVQMLNTINKSMKILNNTQINDFFELVNWNGICSDINTFIKNNTPFNILKLKNTDNVKTIITTIRNIVSHEYTKHINLFVSNVSDINIIFDPTKPFTTYIEKFVPKNIIKLNQILFDSIQCIENIILLYETTTLTNKYEFLRKYNHTIFDECNNIILLNTDLDISNLRISDNYKKSFILDTTILTICENVRQYIYDNREKLSDITQEFFNKSAFKSVKCPLNHITNTEDDKKQINDIVININNIVERAYYFIKMYVLKYYETNDIVLKFINFDFISMCVRTITINDPKGRPVSDANKKLLDTFKIFYDTEFVKIFPDKIRAVGYSQILNSCKDAIKIAYKNNVSKNYFNILKKYIFGTFKDLNKKEYLALNKEDKKRFSNQLNGEIQIIFKDITENTVYKSDVKYHKWIDEHKPKLVPANTNGNILFDIDENPDKYFKYMLNINKLFEINKRKMFNCFPMKSSTIPSNIVIDTVTVMVNFIKMQQNDTYSVTQIIQDNFTFMYLKVWNTTFNLQNRIFNCYKNYFFNNQITTDGFSVSISLTNKDLYGVTLEKSNDKTKEEFEYIDNLGLIESKQKDDKHLELEKEKLKYEIGLLKQQYKFIYVDPGINPDILHFCDDGYIDDKGKSKKTFLKYTTKQRLHQMGTIKFRQRRKRLKQQYLDNDKIDILNIENGLKELSLKTCDYANFIKILKAREPHVSILKTFYQKEIFRKMQFWSYINTNRSEAMLVNKMKQTYEDSDITKHKELLLVYGNWNRSSQMKGTISVPKIGIKRMLHKTFKILNFDEFRTSCMDSNTQTKCVNAQVKVGKKNKTLNSVLVSEIREIKGNVLLKPLKRFQNRNRHAVENFKLIVDGYEQTGERLLLFNRKHKLPETEKFEIKTNNIPVVGVAQVLRSDVDMMTKHFDLKNNAVNIHLINDSK